ncbi:MAG TPA: protein kinase [Labilithrix sp.]|nr:protein kinase [Labilithrix sp.]
MNHRRSIEDFLPAGDFHPAAVGRYLLHEPFARGGMATVHAARLVAAEGVTRLVAAKRLLPQFVHDPEFVEMFHDEARIASRIHHPNVVPVLDVIREGDEAILVQEYVHGVPLSVFMKSALAANEPVPLSIALTIVSGVLSGLHAAHEATDDIGEPLGIIHRDVSPQNVLVSVDGIPRLVDFGIAKARTSLHQTREGFLKGKLAYMAPEQLRAEPVTRSVDVYAAGVILWELIVNRRFHDGKGDAYFVRDVALGSTPTPTEALEAEAAPIPVERWTQVYLLEPIIMRAMASSPTLRYATAAEMAADLAAIAPNASAAEVAAWVRTTGADYLEKRRKLLMPNGEGSRAALETDRPRAPETARSSWTRMRFQAATVDAHPSVTSERRTSLPPAIVTSRRPPPDIETYVIPWVMVAALLIVVGTLVGMVTTRRPIRAAAASPPTVSASRQPSVAATVVAVTATALPSAPVTAATAPPVTSGAAPVASHPAEGRITARTPEPIRTPAPPLRQPAPIIRHAPATRATPVFARSSPTPDTSMAPPPARDCSALFYFDGDKKIPKPGCL